IRAHQDLASTAEPCLRGVARHRARQHPHRLAGARAGAQAQAPLGVGAARPPEHPRHHRAGQCRHADSGHGVVGAGRRPQIPASACAGPARPAGPDRRDQEPLRGAAQGDLPVIEIAIIISMHGVGVAMLMSLYRLIRGPEVVDRILALDTFSINTIALLILDGMYLRSEIYFEAALVIAMLGFVTTVVLCEYVLRRDIVE